MASPASVLILLVSIRLLLLGVQNGCHATNSEAALLLAWRAEIDDHPGSLRDWTDSPSAPCGWTGVTCSGYPLLQVSNIDLSNKGLSGTLTLLALGELTMLQSFNLANNSFSGRIPNDICLCENLQSIVLHDNYFSGPLPQCFSQLHNLLTLDLSYNPFTNFPADIGLSSKLTNLNMEGCGLVGSIPPELSNVTSLTSLNLGRNYLTGMIPPELFLLQQLQGLSLEYNLIEGRIPAILGALPALQSVFMAANNLTGSIPTSIGNLTGLKELYLFNNSLDGNIPVEIGTIAGLAILDISNNFMVGSIPDEVGNLKSLRYLNMSMNYLVGQLPWNLGSLPLLKVLAISSNYLIDNIPQQLGFFSNISVVDLSANYLVGQIPPGICSLGSLSSLILSSNSLSGSIPTNLAQCRSLQVLNLSQNSLTGNFPPSIWSLLSLTHLDLSLNDFSGVLEGARVGDGASLEKLYLQDNHFKGSLPQHFGDLINLRALDLSRNAFSGEVSPQVSNIDQLRELNLSWNDLKGSIPVQFGDLKSLLLLDLSNNELNGSIPTELGNIWSLISLNVSNNHLSGPVPINGAFQSMDMEVQGNLGLCGGPEKLRLEPCVHKLRTRTKIVIIVIACLLALSVIMVYVCNYYKTRTKLQVGHTRQANGVGEGGAEVELAETQIRAQTQLRGIESERLPVIHHDAEALRYKPTDSFQRVLTPSLSFPPSLSLIAWRPTNWPWKFIPLIPDLMLTDMEITETCAPVNLLSRGWSGQSFKGVTHDGRIFVLKKLLRAGTGKNIPRILTKLKQMRHPNIVQIWGYCLGDDGSLVAIVDEYLVGGNLNSALHDGSLSKYPREWTSRFEIAVGTAQALLYLHDCLESPYAPPLHSELTSKNILLNDGMKAHLAVRIDVSEMTETQHCDYRQLSNDSNDITPENFSTTCTDGTDVYNLGVVILELLTGRPVVDKYNTHIVRWVNEARLLGVTVVDMLDPTIGDQPPEILSQMTTVMGMACTCTNSALDHMRPSLEDVLKFLLEVKSESAKS